MHPEIYTLILFRGGIMEKLILAEDDKPPGAGVYPVFLADFTTAKIYYLRILNRRLKRFFYHIKR